MEYQFKTNNNIMFIVILGAIIFFVFIMPMLYDTDKENKIIEENDNIQSVKIYDNICSRECCKFSQWAPPPELTEKKILNEISDNYIGSNMSCNGGDKGGCLCISKEDYNYLSNRGGNS
jgi:hypothetical protein